MVDFVSYDRIHGYRFLAEDTREPVTSTYRDLYRETAFNCFNRPRPKTHDCRAEVAIDATDNQEWQAWLLSHGLRKSYDAVRMMNVKHVPRDPLLRTPEKLLLELGSRGSGKMQFEYPRDIVTDSNSDVIVCDSHNERVQRMNVSGVYKDEFGLKGTSRGEFSRPVGLAVLPNDDVAVADSGNKRIQVFRSNGRLKHVFNTDGTPRYVAVDSSNNYIVSTGERVIEIYDQSRMLMNHFKLLPARVKRGSMHHPVAVGPRGEIVVCDTDTNTIQILDYEGSLMFRWTPQSPEEGMSVSMVSMTLDPTTGQIIICDGLNRTISLYTHRGEFLKYLLKSTDGLGPPQGCTVSPEGHLWVTEAACNGEHCIKMFRYRECECHRSRGGTSKRTTPVASRATTAK